MYTWANRYQEECATGRFNKKDVYEIHRRGYSVTLRYFGSVSTKSSGKTADVFCGVHDGGTNKGEVLFFALMNGRYASSNNAGKALQKLWSGKTNKLHGIYQQKYGQLIRV